LNGRPFGEEHWRGGAGSSGREFRRLAEQNLDISLIVNHENKQAHGRPPDLAADRELTQPITCIVGRSRAINSKDAAAPRRSVNGPRHCAQRHEKYQISNRERCAEHHSHEARRDEARL